MGKYTAVAKDILNTLQTEAGVLLSKFDPTTGAIKDDDILGATTGGFKFNDTPTITDFGEDIDNVPGQLKQLQRITKRAVTLSSTFASMSEKAVKFVMGACDATDMSGANPDKKVRQITPRDTLQMDDFASEIWWVGDYSQYNEPDNANAGYIAIRLRSALSTGGLAITTTKSSKGTMAFTVTGYYNAANIKEMPYEIFIKEGDVAASE
nr:MAG TPA: major tail protein [Caudoviricetes sp.]